jgi:WD40 repeat protein
MHMRELRRLKGRQPRVTSPAWNSGGNCLASASVDGTVTLWEVESGQARATLLRTREGWVLFTPDGRYKIGGEPRGEFWYILNLCRFEVGELDDVIPGIRRMGIEEPI